MRSFETEEIYIDMKKKFNIIQILLHVSILIKNFSDLRNKNKQQMKKTENNRNIWISYTSYILNSMKNKPEIFSSHIEQLNICCSNPVWNKKSTKTCSQCYMVRYCSSECQRLNWPAHKKFCKKCI